MSLSDQRRPPFCYQTHGALDAIRSYYANGYTDAGGEWKKPYGKLNGALGIYLTFTEVANRNGGSDARTGFDEERGVIAEAAGVSRDTLDRYIAEFVRAGVLKVKRRQVGKINMPNTWILLEPEVASSAPPSRVDAATPSRVDAAEEQELKLQPEETPPIVPPYAQVAESWLSHAPPLIRHRASYFQDRAVKRKVDRAVARYGVQDVCAAISALAAVLASAEHYWTHSWPLADFLSRGLDKFVPEAEPLKNFRRDRNGGARNSEGVDLSVYNKF